MLALRATTIQKAVRGWIHRIQFARMKSAAIVIEKYWRGYIQRQRYRQVLTLSKFHESRNLSFFSICAVLLKTILPNFRNLSLPCLFECISERIWGWGSQINLNGIINLNKSILDIDRVCASSSSASFKADCPALQTVSGHYNTISGLLRQSK